MIVRDGLRQAPKEFGSQKPLEERSVLYYLKALYQGAGQHRIEDVRENAIGVLLQEHSEQTGPQSCVVLVQPLDDSECFAAADVDEKEQQVISIRISQLRRSRRIGEAEPEALQALGDIRVIIQGPILCPFNRSKQLA